MSMVKTILEFQHVDKLYQNKHKTAPKVLKDINFSLYENEILGIVGESGSGKSTIAKLITKLEDFQNGDILFEGESIRTFNKSALKRYRQAVQMIFQDPDSSLNPRKTVKDIILEGIKGFDMKVDNLDAYVTSLLNDVGLPENFKERYPVELSGGQKQRVGIARCLAVKPRIIVADEPISALDVSIQAQIINLLKSLKIKKNLTIIFIGHDLNVVKYICDRTIVLYDGAILEYGDSTAVLHNPQHPYTNRLIQSSPVDHPGERKGLTQEVSRERPTYGEVTGYAQVKDNHYIAIH
ncbi:ABC transporter ATP-binding protein [Macrococcus capreoli]|uniref:ABC transporter ATP-binding protein n=1 Tax=Macrococcus capreoli TaxID=2982690 RepID=UPI003EE711A4